MKESQKPREDSFSINKELNESELDTATGGTSIIIDKIKEIWENLT